jgi:hypothetical protein
MIYYEREISHVLKELINPLMIGYKALLSFRTLYSSHFTMNLQCFLTHTSSSMLPLKNLDLTSSWTNSFASNWPNLLLIWQFLSLQMVQRFIWSQGQTFARIPLQQVLPCVLQQIHMVGTSPCKSIWQQLVYILLSY